MSDYIHDINIHFVGKDCDGAEIDEAIRSKRGMIVFADSDGSAELGSSFIGSFYDDDLKMIVALLFEKFGINQTLTAVTGVIEDIELLRHMRNDTSQNDCEKPDYKTLDEEENSDGQ